AERGCTMAHVEQSGGSREPYWRMALARWKRSGPSVRAFCRAEGLNQGSLYWWRRGLDGRAQPQPAVLPGRSIPQRDKPPALSLEVLLANGRSVRVGPGFDPQTLVRVLKLLEEGGPSC